MELFQKLIKQFFPARTPSGPIPTSLSEVTAVLITQNAEYPKEIELAGFGEVIIKTNCPNIYTRYTEALRAKYDTIYVQDDDCILDYRELFKHYNGRITNGMRGGRTTYYKNISGGRITLVGWGAFFPKSMLSVIGDYSKKYGMDDAHLMRETDRIFTWLNYPHNTVNMPHTDLESFVAPSRMHADPKHFEYVKEVMVKLNTMAPRTIFSLPNFLRPK